MQNNRTVEGYINTADEIIGDRLASLEDEKAASLRSDAINRVASIRRGLGCGAISRSCATCVGLSLEEPICQTVSAPEPASTQTTYGRAFY